MNEHNNKRSFDTLVLSGGAMKGILVIGALQYAFDENLLNDVQTYVGTSAGAVICFLLIIGYTPREIMVTLCTNRIMEKLQNFNVVSMINGLGAASFAGLQEHLEKMTITKIGYLPTLAYLHEKFKKKLICCTYNLSKSSTEYLSYENHPELPCLIALRMSSNLPLIFEKYNYNDSFYIDGGLADNFPIHIGDQLGSRILGILISSQPENFNKIQDMDIMEYIYNLMSIPSNEITLLKNRLVTEKSTIVTLSYENIKIFNFAIDSKTKLEMFSSGYQQCKQILKANII